MRDRIVLMSILLVVSAPAYAQPSIDVGSAGGAPGDRVSFDVTLNGASETIVATQNLLAFDVINTPIAATATGSPDCWPNPDIGKDDSFFVFLPAGCVGSGCTALRAIVISLDAGTVFDPIPNGSVLYSCAVDISSAALFGSYPVTISDTLAVAPPGVSVLAVGSDGAIIVGRTPTNRDDCKNGGWRTFGNPLWFNNQGDCIQYVNTGR